MPYTYRDYPPYDIAVATYSNAREDGGLIRYQAGDIVAAVRAIEGIGLADCCEYLWLRVQGWDSSLMDRLMDEITDKTQADPLYADESGQKPIVYEKARFCIPLESMRRILPGFSVERATDTNDVYQPFMNLDQGGIANLGTEPLYVSVDPFEWYPRIIDDPKLLADVMAQLTPESTLTLPRATVEPEFAEAALGTGYFLITYPPIDPDGLIFDKFTQKYLYG